MKKGVRLFSFPCLASAPVRALFLLLPVIPVKPMHIKFLRRTTWQGFGFPRLARWVAGFLVPTYPRRGRLACRAGPSHFRCSPRRVHC